MFRVVAFVPQDFSSLEVEADEGATLVAAVGAIKASVENDHATVVVLHLFAKINFLGLDGAVPIFNQLHQPAAGAVGRGGKHLSVLVERRGAANPMGIGGTIIAPEELTVG